MYYADGTYYTEEHSVSFGDLYVPSGQSYTAFNVVANTWTDWHLIPSSRPAIAHPTVVTKFVENPGSDGLLEDLYMVNVRVLYLSMSQMELKTGYQFKIRLFKHFMENELR